MEFRGQTLYKDRHCWPATEVDLTSEVKEETMKKFICIAVALMLILIFIGCSTMTPEQRKETYDLRGSVGNQPFVGGTGGLDSRGLFYAPVTMY